MKLDTAYLEVRDCTTIRLGSWGLGVSQTHIPSDTLFSALVNVTSLLYGRNRAEDLIQATREGRFRISSSFPRLEILQDGKSVSIFHFFPKPMLRPAKTETTSAKKLKKLSFLEKSLFQNLLLHVKEEEEGIRSSFDLVEQSSIIRHKFAIPANALDSETEALLEQTRFSPFLTEDDFKVTVDRWSSASQPFSQGSLFLQASRAREKGREYQFIPGFFFCFHADEEVKSIFTPALRLLADEGIGGKRSSGNGFFTQAGFEVLELDLAGGKYSTSLSLVFPRREEKEADSIKNYMLCKRGGFVFSPEVRNLRKRLVRMVEEGAIFHGLPQGDMPEVASGGGHEVYQYGYAFCLSFGE